MKVSGGLRWRRFLLEASVAVVLLAGLWAWQTRNLLPADERVLAPALGLVDLDGRRWDIPQLAGKPVVVYFFAPWCQVCAASAHQLRWFQRVSGDTAGLVLVALDWESVDELRAYATRHALEAPLLVGDARVALEWRVQAYPTYYVLDSAGRVAGADLGFTTAPGLWLRTMTAR